MRKGLDKVAALAPILAASLGVAGLVSRFAIDAKVVEIMIAVGAVVVAAVAGVFSKYIARATKTLPHQPRIFISYSHNEKAKARKLRDVLMEQGAKVWFDENELQPGSDFASSISAAIENSNAMVILASNKVGAHVGAELRAALDRNVPVVALMATETPPEFLKDKNVQILKFGTDLHAVATAALAAR